MMIKRLFALVLIVGMIWVPLSAAAAQSSYSFSLDKEIVQAFWNSDGTLSVDYVFTFTNDPNGHVIDFVDVGMPNGDYDSGSIKADVVGKPVKISTDYQGQGSYGFSVDMGAYAIQPGQQGSMHVYVGRISRMVYPDTDTPDTYASGEFSPTWFDSQYVHGATDLTMIFHLPPGVKPEEPRYHKPSGWPGDSAPQAAIDDQQRVTYTWRSPDANGSTQYTFGASFPKQTVPADAIVVAPPFDFSGFIAGLIGSLFNVCFCGFFILMFVGVPILGVINASRRKLQYLPPKIQIEGHGIKRGLTAVEAAILMEQPLDKVMTMILFGVVKKGAAQVTSREPLQIQAADPTPEIRLRDYESSFLKAFAQATPAARKTELQGMMVALVNSVSENMKGFSRKETMDYYKNIMERAWQQIEAAGTPEVKSQMYDESMEWTMLDKEYDQRTRRVFTGPVFVPIWWGRYDPTFHPTVSTVGPVGMPGGQQFTLPGANIAASIVTGAQNFSSQVIGDVNTFTSGITNRTNPIPVTTSRGGSGGGGHCACACAGCACACAGGGR